ncbi:glycosyl transferase family protein [Xanthobacter oligotrophicus]|uniref:Glycosyl transferase family protein n=1 Tax=Xanthobacter oligotrophicus TaxID=2607286 RepID=A0ABW7A2J1_9HYPH
MPLPEHGDPRATDEGPRPQQGRDTLARGRLLLALDALLTTRSVTHAAARLGLQASGVSRILGELRDALGDQLLIRSGRGLVPSPLAETLRPKVRALAAGIREVFEPEVTEAAPAAPFDHRWNVPHRVPVEPLAYRSSAPLHDAPFSRAPADRAEDVVSRSEPSRRLAYAIGLVGAGRGKSLDAEEAEFAMATILRGEADPVQIGAFFSFIQARGVTAMELAGFVRAARTHVNARLGHGSTIAADLDWPCYTSPKCQKPPWFFHAAQLVAQAGHRVVLHGSSGAGAVSGRFNVIADKLAIPICSNAEEVSYALSHRGIAYVPLAELSPQLFRLMGLYALTNTRSPVNELVHLLQPVPAKASLLGVAKPSYRELHRYAGGLLGIRDLAILANARDVAQFAPYHLTTIHRLVNGAPIDTLVASRPAPPATIRTSVTSLEYWQGVWSGSVKDRRAEEIIIATAAGALLTIWRDAQARYEDARDAAEALWRARQPESRSRSD